MTQRYSPHIPNGWAYLSDISTVIKMVMEIKYPEDITALLNQRVQLRQSFFYAIPYLDLASRSLHDYLLQIFRNDFLKNLIKSICCLIPVVLPGRMVKNLHDGSKIKKSIIAQATTKSSGGMPFTFRLQIYYVPVKPLTASSAVSVPSVRSHYFLQNSYSKSLFIAWPFWFLMDVFLTTYTIIMYS